MQFNSIEFIFFFPFVAACCFSLPPHAQRVWLLLASYLFYMAWNPFYILLIWISTLTDYGVARAMENHTDKRGRRKWLYVSLCINLGLLFAFKYANLAGDALTQAGLWIGVDWNVPYLDILLPVGISFYTFQTLSYTIEVYRGNQKAERSLVDFALYVAYFPQLVAGPIERPQHLLPQLKTPKYFDYDRVVSGLRLVLWGIFKKVVIADRLAVMVNVIYDQPERYPGSFLTLATVFFAFQIYCDFSGYTDIARGCARVLGVDLMKNFNRPYMATSIRDFWRRWHISLSTWFRDYVYVPCGGNRGSTAAWALGLFAVFLLSGLWHGANYTFVVWGLLHFGYYLFGRATHPLRSRLVHALGLTKVPGLLPILQVTTTFVLVCIGWVFFRAESMGQAVYILSHLHERWFDLSPNGGFKGIVASLDLSVRAFALNIGLVCGLVVAEGLIRDREPGEWLGDLPMPLRWAGYTVLGLLIMNLGLAEEIPFVYFQF
ncbi:MAG: membrane-bound O-acyltransferase family protein [Candidatus Hydrogenedentota bacterium]|nr:MAG: membrane-bound O-acyltransferase family protein [Candidatus Hydrogenedentota bacterium]